MNKSTTTRDLLFTALGLLLVFSACRGEHRTVALETVAMDPPAAPGSFAAELTVDEDTVLLSWLEPRGAGDTAGHALIVSRWDAASTAWSAPRTLYESGSLFANWADRPRVLAVEGGLLAHVLEMLPEAEDPSYAYGVTLVADADSAPRSLGLLHDDASPEEHGFVSWVPLGDDTVQAFWLDGRSLHLASSPDDGMHLRTARLDPRALLRGDSAPPPPSTRLDARTCECCATDAVLTEAGPLVAYRDRDADETRDIAVVRAVDDGWSAPQRVAEDGWRIHGCPVNGPALDAQGSRVAIAWYTAAQDHPRLRAAFSDDSGASWSSPIELEVDTAEEIPLGRLDLVLDDNGGAVLSWLAQRRDANGENTGVVRLRRVHRDGTLGAARDVATTSPSRRAGVPRLVRLGDELVVTWIEVRGDAPGRLRVSRLPIGMP